MKLLAIVPCHNEEAAIVPVIERIRSAQPRCDILVVDDGSTDRTAELARGAGAKVASLPYNMGLAATVQTGYLYAVDEGYDIAVQVDGDGQHDPEEIEKVIAPIRDEGVDLVVGSRFLQPEGFKSTRIRRIGIVFFSWLLTVLTGNKNTDCTSGFRASGKRCTKLFAFYYPDDYPAVESLFLAHFAGLKVREVPVLMMPRTSGSSLFTPMRSVYFIAKGLMVLFIWLLRKKPELDDD